MTEDHAAVLGAGIAARRALGGGSLSRVTELTLTDGRRVVLKEAPGADREAEMLRAINAAGCPAPEVLHATTDHILMTLLSSGTPPDDRAWEAAGQAIRTLHGTRGAPYGWTTDHAFGAAPIPNAPAPDWPRFWAERRLLAWPEALPADIARRLDRLAARMPDLLPASPPPALLHGDLWSGNLLFGPTGFSGVIDPASYGGDGEVDLAMLTLFGSPPPAFFTGYGPLAPGWAARRAVYQLWPALVHLRLFGGGYRRMVETLLARCGA